LPKKQIKVKRAPSRQQLSRRQRERKIQRITLYVGVSLISLVLLFIAFGFYNNEIRPLRKPAFKVNDVVIRTENYVDALKLFAQSENPVIRANIADYALDFMQTNELIKQAAIKAGVVLTPAEISEAMSKSKTSMEPDKLRNLIVVDLYAQKTRENLASKVPARSDQVHLMSILLENREKAQDIRERLNAGEEFASMARQFSLDPASRDKGGDLGWMPRELVDKGIVDVAFRTEPGGVSEPLGQEGTPGFYLLKVVERKNDAEITPEMKERMASQAFADWVSGLRKEATVEVYLSEKDKLKALALAGKK